MREASRGALDACFYMIINDPLSPCTFSSTSDRGAAWCRNCEDEPIIQAVLHMTAGTGWEVSLGWARLGIRRQAAKRSAVQSGRGRHPARCEVHCYILLGAWHYRTPLLEQGGTLLLRLSGRMQVRRPLEAQLHTSGSSHPPQQFDSHRQGQRNARQRMFTSYSFVQQRFF